MTKLLPCPECGAPMKLRTPKPGQSWRAFLGCSQYPDCRGTRQLADDGEPEQDAIVPEFIKKHPLSDSAGKILGLTIDEFETRYGKLPQDCIGSPVKLDRWLSERGLPTLPRSRKVDD